LRKVNVSGIIHLTFRIFSLYRKCTGICAVLELLRAVNYAPSPNKLVILVFSHFVCSGQSTGKGSLPMQFNYCSQKVCLIVVILRLVHFVVHRSRAYLFLLGTQALARLPCRRPFSACTCTPGRIATTLAGRPFGSTRLWIPCALAEVNPARRIQLELP